MRRPDEHRLPGGLSPLAFLGAGVLVGVMLGTTSRRARIAAGLAGAGLVALASRDSLGGVVRALGQARRRVWLRRSIEVQRPLREVFAFCRDFENFPLIFGSLRRVVDHEDGLSQWEAYTPSGEAVAWDVRVTKYVPNSVIAWRSLPGSDMDSAGQVRFHALSPDRTRLDIELQMSPRSTTVRDAVATLLGPPPSAQLAQELSRARFFLESLPSSRLR